MLSKVAGNGYRRNDGSYTRKLHVPEWDREGFVVDKKGHPSKLGKGKGKDKSYQIKIVGRLHPLVNRIYP